LFLNLKMVTKGQITKGYDASSSIVHQRSELRTKKKLLFFHFLEVLLQLM